MKKLAMMLLAVAAFAGCRDQKGETPNENYEMNRGEEIDNTATATDTAAIDTAAANSTQTDPAVTD